VLASRSIRLILAGIGLLLLIGVAWCAWLAWQVNQDLQDAVDHADAFQQAIESGDDDATQRELTALEESSASAEERTSGVTTVVHDLSQDGLQPLVEVQDELPGLLPKDGTIPVEEIAALEEPVAQAEKAFQDADETLSAEDSSGFMGRLRTPYDDLAGKVSTASQAMSSARIAIDLLPGMLGQDGDRTYLVAFQNNAEIRATGGLPASVAVMHAADGALDLERQVPIGTLGAADEQVLPLSDAEKKLFGQVPALYFQSSNMTPDVPRAAELMRARWEQDFPDEDVDGIVLVDTVALGYVLDATGPITIDGVQLTGDNLVDELLNNTYLRLADDAQGQDAFFADVADAVFDRFMAGAADPTTVLRALARATDEGRISLHSFDDTEQQAIAGTRIAGELVTDADDPRPQINLTVNDTTGAKMSYYLRYDTKVHATYCTDGVQGFAGTAKLRSEAPADAADLPRDITGHGNDVVAGNQWVTVRLYGPAAGEIGEVTLNAKPLEPILVDEDGRPVAMFYVELKPGQTVDLSWTMKSGAGQTRDADFDVTPSIEPGDRGGQVGSAC
jgi:hypothetical protein